MKSFLPFTEGFEDLLSSNPTLKGVMSILEKTLNDRFAKSKVARD